MEDGMIWELIRNRQKMEKREPDKEHKIVEDSAYKGMMSMAETKRDGNSMVILHSIPETNDGINIMWIGSESYY